MPKFTDLFIDKLPYSQKRTEVYDTLLPAFGCRVGARTKTWFVVDSEGSRRKLGRYPTLKLAQARELARNHMQNGTTGQIEAFPAILDAYTRLHLTPNCRPTHAKEIERLLRKHFPFTQPIGQITRRDITAAIDRIEHHSLANHATVAIKMLMNWAEERGHLTTNPIAKLKKPYREEKRERVLSYEELAKVWTAASQMKEFGILIKLCLLLGTRRSEIYKASSEMLEKNILQLPSTLTKNKRPHSLPLSENSARLFLMWRQVPINWSKKKLELDKLSGVTNWVLHDLRRTFATNLAGLQCGPHIIERILNHTSGTISGVSAIYNRHLYMDEAKRALELYENELVKRGVIR